MNRQTQGSRTQQRTIAIIAAAVVALAAIVTAVLMLIPKDGPPSNGHQAPNPAPQSYTFTAVDGGYHGMLKWTVTDGRIDGQYIEVSVPDGSSTPVESVPEHFTGKDGDPVRLDGLLHDGGSIEGTISGSKLTLNHTFSPIETDWSLSSEAQFRKDAGLPGA